MAEERAEFDLADEFEVACQYAIEQSRELDYNPNYWERSIKANGAVEAARKLLSKREIQSGFERLVREGRVDLTVEFAVLNPRWDGLFDAYVRSQAWRRLNQAVRPPR